MFVGQTGSEKIILLNAYINYLIGLNYEEWNQDESLTSEVTVYNLKAPDGAIIQIVDTPWFGNTLGSKKVIEITQKIWQVFINVLFSITCISLVAQYSNVKLSAEQKYIFNCILDLK